MHGNKHADASFTRPQFFITRTFLPSWPGLKENPYNLIEKSATRTISNATIFSLNGQIGQAIKTNGLGALEGHSQCSCNPLHVRYGSMVTNIIYGREHISLHLLLYQ